MDCYIERPVVNENENEIDLDLPFPMVKSSSNIDNVATPHKFCSCSESSDDITGNYNENVLDDTMTASTTVITSTDIEEDKQSFNSDWEEIANVHILHNSVNPDWNNSENDSNDSNEDSDNNDSDDNNSIDDTLSNKTVTTPIPRIPKISGMGNISHIFDSIKSIFPSPPSKNDDNDNMLDSIINDSLVVMENAQSNPTVLPPCHNDNTVELILREKLVNNLSELFIRKFKKS